MARGGHREVAGGASPSGEDVGDRGGSGIRSPYGGWQGYISLIETDFNLANEKAWEVGITYDWGGTTFPAFRVPGLSTSLLYAEGFDIKAQAQGVPVGKRREGDLFTVWRPPQVPGSIPLPSLLHHQEPVRGILRFAHHPGPRLPLSERCEEGELTGHRHRIEESGIDRRCKPATCPPGAVRALVTEAHERFASNTEGGELDGLSGPGRVPVVCVESARSTTPAKSTRSGRDHEFTIRGFSRSCRPGL